MLDPEDLKWVATTSTELNAMLQQIARYSDLARQHKGEYNYVDLLGERVELASKTAQAMFDRITSKILAGPSGSPVEPARASSSAAVPATSRPPEPTVAKSLAATPAGGEAPSAPAEIKIMNPEGKRELILLVDDEAEIAGLASEMLADEGYKVIVAPDGFEALRIYQEMGKQIGLVILDFFLPVMDGDAVFDELRLLNPNINVVLSSGLAEKSKLGAMLAQGLRGFIPKPYTREKLLAQVRSTLDAARQSH
jgi:CheY-like chemotaxis protein